MRQPPTSSGRHREGRGARPRDVRPIEVSTSSRVGKAVQKAGLIRRKGTVEDQRAVRVTLTDQGRDLVQRNIPSAVRMQPLMIGGMTPKDVQTVTRLLHVMP